MPKKVRNKQKTKKPFGPKLGQPVGGRGFSVPILDNKIFLRKELKKL